MNISYDNIQNFDQSPNSKLIYELFPLLTIIWTITNIKIKNDNFRSHLKNIDVAKTHLILSLLLFASFLIISPILMVLLLCFRLYRLFVGFLLKQKHNGKYGGLLEGTDAFWTIEDTSKSIINILLIVNYDGSAEYFYETVKKNVSNKFYSGGRFPKFSSVREYYLGYYYFVLNEFGVDDCVMKINFDTAEEKISHSELQKTLSIISNRSLPKDHKAGWEILVGNKPILWKQNHIKQYPVVVRIHHSLVDGVSLLKVFVGCFADKNKMDQNKATLKNCRNDIDQGLMMFKKWIGQVFTNICAISFAPAIMLLQQVMRTKDNNILHGSELSSEKNMLWNVEIETKYVDMVKSIKRNIPGSSFCDVLMTAVSASFNEFFKENCSSIPESLTTIIPAIPQISDLPKIIPGEYDDQEAVLHNRFSVGMFNLPVYLYPKTSLKSRLVEVKHHIDALKNSPDFQVNYWLLKIVSAFVPVPLLKPIINSAHSTMVVSNLPGPRKLILFDGHELDDIVFWIPNKGTTGLGMSILTYDGRFQIGLIIDKVLVADESKTQMILDNIFRQLELLNKECS